MPEGLLSQAQTWSDALEQRLPSARISVHDTDPIPPDIDYLVTWQPRPGLFSALPALRAVFTASAGVDAIIGAGELPDCPIIRLRDAGMGKQMADYALYAGLHYQRGFDYMRAAQASREWQPDLGQVRDRPVVGILGLGTLGSVVAEVLRENGFEVRGWSRSPKQFEGVATYAGLDQLDAFLSGTEMLFCLLPLTTDTRGLIDRERLAALPQGAAVVNVARGPILVEEDLLAAIESGHIRGAMLDVFSTEPLPQDNALWRHPCVTVTPHIAAATLIEPSADHVASQIDRIERGIAPEGVVDRKRGY